MITQLDVPPEAQVHVYDADLWWRKNRPAAPTLFREEFEESIALLARTPKIGKPYRRRGIPGLRRLLMPRTRYHIYYVPDVKELTILAVWSAVRGRPPPLAHPQS